MSSYYPDPPVQSYWPDEPYRYWSDYHGTDYWPETFTNGYEMDGPVSEPVEETAERDTSIWRAPILAAVSTTSLSPTIPAPRKREVPTPKPVFRLVPPGISDISSSAVPAPSALNDMASITDRRVLLIDARQALEMLLESDDSDGYTRAELEPYLKSLEDTLGRVKKRVRGNLLHRVSRFLRPDES